MNAVNDIVKHRRLSFKTRHFAMSLTAFDNIAGLYYISEYCTGHLGNVFS